MSWLFHCDIFISYSHADKEWVEQLERELGSEFKMCRDKEIKPGDNWLKWIKKALKRSLVGLVVLSPDAVKSEMVTYEWVTLYNRLEKSGKLITLLYRDIPEIPELLKSIHYVDFRNPADRQEKLEELLKTLRGKLKGCKSLPLIRVGLLTLIILLAFPVIIKGVYAYFQNNRSISSLHQTQREIQTLEVRLAPVINRSSAMLNGEQKYEDTDTHEHVVTDHWESGKLIWRNFYQQKRLIARDSFLYVGGTVNGKVRTYMDEDQRPFLLDYFTQDGSLTKKRYCPQGTEQPCDERVDDMRSPLPPSGLLIYR